MLKRLFYCICLFLPMLATAAPTVLLGVALEADTDRPIPYVDVSYQSGKMLGKTNAQGRMDFTVDSRNASLVFKKEGYDSLSVSLQDFSDLMDVVVVMHPNVRNLGQSTVVGGGEVIKWENPSHVSVEKLEDVAGMRFDIAELLSQVEGVSGQRDFSNELYYDGSRAEEVGYHLGRLRIPSMRHLDVGFPGNLSVINPHMLRGVEIHDHYGTGPLGQGLATSVQYQPEVLTGEDFELQLSAGTTVREITVGGPWLFWDSFRFSYRFLDSEMLKNMGEKFFTEFRKRDASCTDCSVASSDPFDLTSFDIYGQIAGSDSLDNSWMINTVYSNDTYVIRQDTATALDVSNSVDIIRGEREYAVVGLEYNSALGVSWHMGMVREQASDSLRDTTGFRNTTDKEASNFIDGYSQTHTTLSVGADKPFPGHILGANLSGLALYEHHIIERKWPDFSDVQSTDLSADVLSGSTRMDWISKKQKVALAMGAVADRDGHGMPTASLDMDRHLSEKEGGWRVFGNAAWRADWVSEWENDELQSNLASGASAKLGLGYKTKYVDWSAHGFGRYYFEPALPTPLAYAHYTELSEADFAWVSGASGTLELKTTHHFSMGSNINSVYGEYELKDDRSLPWQANSRLDVVSFFRYYPRKDSLISVVVSHHAAWKRPLYYYEINPSDASTETSGTRKIKDYNEFTNLYRTDFRVNLDLQNGIYFFRNVRFYVEADNIFANLDVNALHFLGSENARQRSQMTEDADGNASNGYNLVPYMAKGMGLYLQFGVEANFGI